MVELDSIPTTNSLDLRITFLLNGAAMRTLNVGEAKVLEFSFDAIAVGSSKPLSIYDQETPGDLSINPGNLAFVDRSVHRKIALRYGEPGGIQQNIVFALPD